MISICPMEASKAVSSRSVFARRRSRVTATLVE